MQLAAPCLHTARSSSSGVVAAHPIYTQRRGLAQRGKSPPSAAAATTGRRRTLQVNELGALIRQTQPNPGNCLHPVTSACCA